MPRRRDDITDHLLRLPWPVTAGIGAGLLVVSLFSGITPAGTPLNVWSPVLRIFSYLVLFISFVSAVRSFFMRRQLEVQSGLASIQDLSWAQFEQLLAEAYRRQGYSVRENFAGGPDGGVDLELNRPGERVLVQCKNWKTRSVGVKVVREMAGLLLNAPAGTRVVIVTSGSYTQDARDFAAGKPIELIDGPALWSMIEHVQTGPRTAAVAAPAGPPVCPRCGAALVERTARRGENAGSRFWGCSSYPM